ncbi:MAG: FtsX-like permease family protein [Bifidobacteriaceae bacterium]|nr:FtsX-like permease family protein [Bifidobacteriaceae bacterium]
MLRYTLRQMRASLKQLVAVSTAVVVSTGFVAAALIGSGAVGDVLYNMVAARFAGGDLVVYLPGNEPMEPKAAAAAMLSVDEVEAVAPQLSGWVEVSAGGRVEWTEMAQSTEYERLNSQPVIEGREPTAADEVSMSDTVAERLSVSIGDVVNIAVDVYVDGGTEPTEVPEEVTEDEAGSGDTASGQADTDGDSAAADQGEAAGTDAGAEGVDDPEPGESSTHRITVPARVTGLFDGSGSLWTLPSIQAPQAVVDVLNPTGPEIASPFWLSSLVVAAAPGSDLSPGSDVRERVGAAIIGAAKATPKAELEDFCATSLRADSQGLPINDMGDDGCTVRVLDIEQQTQETVADFMGSTAILTAIVLIFGLLGLFVAAMAISNTYQVLIAGRTRTLALMRAVGATRKQVRQTVLTEGAIMGFGGSIVGLAVGWALVQAALVIAGGMYPALPLPDWPRMNWLAAVVCLAAGVVTALLASMVPARLASRVPPVAALRPLEPPKLSSGAGKARLGLSVSAAGLGLAAVIGGLAINSAVDLDQAGSDVTLFIGSVLGVIGAGTLAVGVLLGSVFWLPKVVSLVAGIFRRFGGAARIAAANSVRNPRRTAAAAAALMIGVTLVTALIVGAGSMSASLTKEIGRYAPVDLRVGSSFSVTISPEEAQAPDFDAGISWESVPQELISQVEATPGVDASVLVHSGLVGYVDSAGETWYYTAFGIDQAGMRDVILDQDFAGLLRPGAVLADESFIIGLGASTEEDETGAGADPSSSGAGAGAGAGAEASRESKLKLVGTDGRTVERTVVYRPDYEYLLPSDAIIMDLETLRELGAATTVAEVWFKLAEDADPIEVATEVQETVTAMSGEGGPLGGEAFMVSGQAVERVAVESAVDTMLLVGLALLAVSVIVALVGVSNTLGLSVLERGRETAMLRALGLTRKQAARMMALEGAIISGVAGLTGVILGTFFGLVGCALLLSATEFMTLAVPVWRILLVLALAILTGLLASVLPGRRAAKTPPAQALAAAG